MRPLAKYLALALGIVALSVSGSAEVQEALPLRVATFRCDVTPPIGGHPLIWTVPAKTIEDPLWAKGIVLDDGHTRYVLCAVDWCGLCDSSYDLFRRKLAEAVGTAVTNVAVQTVHQHTAPYTSGDAQKILNQYPDPPKYVDFSFLEEVTDRLAAAAKESLTQLKPFDSVGVGQADVHHVAATRRVIGPDGKIQIRWSSCKDPALRAMPDGKIDPMVKTVTLAQGDKPLVRLHFYATHPQTFYGDARASADFVGHARDLLEKEEGVFQIYFNGCGGDITVGKYNDGSREARQELTDRLLTGIKASVASTKYQPAGKLAWLSVPLTLQPRTDGEYALEPSLAAIANPKQSSREATACRVAFDRRADRPFDLSCLEIGDVRLVCLPGECLIEFQLYAQQQLPGKFVAVAAYGDLSPGYICPEKAFTEGGYEPTASHTAPSSEQRLKAAIRQLLGLQ
jgi:hypothetical protein